MVLHNSLELEQIIFLKDTFNPELELVYDPCSYNSV